MRRAHGHSALVSTFRGGRFGAGQLSLRCVHSDDHPCVNGGVCLNLDNMKPGTARFTCHCKPGFAAANCSRVNGALRILPNALLRRRPP